MSEETGSVQSGTPTPAAGTSNWYDSIQDTQIKEWASVKGLKSPEAAAQTAWHLEKLLGADKAGRGVIWPKDETDVDGWSGIYNKLGRPESPDGYGLSVEEGQDDSFLKAITPKMHELGLTKKQAQGLADVNNQFLAKHNEAIESEWAEKSNEQFAALQKEWGNDFERNAEMAKRALNYAGLTKDQGVALERALGVDVASKMLSFFGANYVEHASPGHFNTGGDNTASARARISDLKQDADFAKRLYNGDASAKSEWDKLHTIAYPQ